MYKGHRYIDADSHVLEPADMWEKYLEPKFRRYAPTHGVGYRGDPPGFYLQIKIGGSVMPTFQMPEVVQLPGLTEAYGDYMKRGFGPDCYQTALERTGMDYMVLYPDDWAVRDRGAGAVGRGGRRLPARLQQLAARLLHRGGSQTYRRGLG